MSTLELMKVIFGGIISLTAVIITFLVYLIRRREPWGRALFEMAKIMESDELRSIRRNVVYKYPIGFQEEWTAENLSVDQTRQAIDRWGVQMDMLSLLYFSRQLNKVLFFEMYGDVVIRSAYRLASYANRQRLKRGQQFWLPFQTLTLAILRLWKKRSKKGKFPSKIGFPDSSDGFTLETMLNDLEFRRFLQANNRSLL
jgi:hypothetical protein